MVDSMRDVRLDEFLAGVRLLVEGGDGPDVVELGETLMEDAAPGELATARAPQHSRRGNIGSDDAKRTALTGTQSGAARTGGKIGRGGSGRMCGLSLLAAAGEAAPDIDLDTLVVARHEYADVLSAYVEQAAPSRPAQIAQLLLRVEATGMTYDAQWLRLYRALDGTASADFDALAEGHLNSHSPHPNSADRWIRRLPTARFMARRGRPGSEHLRPLVLISDDHANSSIDTGRLSSTRC